MSEETNDDREVTVADDTADEVVPYKYSITSYGADYPVDSLVTRLDKDVIFVPHFQRSYVWTIKQASRFVESLLLGLPVPGVFFSKEPETGKLLIIDGHQRLKTLEFFYRGVFQDGREFGLKNVQQRFDGKTIRTLEQPDRLTLDDSIIHATIVKQDEPSDDQSSIYHIFERLNTGGTLLQPQEIRACIFHGPFNDLLGELNRDLKWREVYGPASRRLKDQELILRFLALFFRREKYKRPIKEFMNDYMGKNRRLQLQDADVIKGAFLPTISLIHGALGNNAFRPEGVLNAAVFDAVMDGLAVRLQKEAHADSKSFIDRYDALLADKTFFNACKTATSDETNVMTRIKLASELFADLP